MCEAARASPTSSVELTKVSKSDGTIRFAPRLMKAWNGLRGIDVKALHEVARAERADRKEREIDVREALAGLDEDPLVVRGVAGE